MGESPAPISSDGVSIGELGLEKARCDPIGTDRLGEEEELGEAIERELLELVIAQAEVEAARGGFEAEGKGVEAVEEGNYAEEKKATVDCAEDENGGDEVGEDKDGKHAENVEEGIENERGDEEDGGNAEGLSGEEMMKLGRLNWSNNRRKSNYPVRPDAEDCAYYMKFGSCKFGFNCKFNHPPRRKNQVKDKAKHREENSERAAAQTECKYYLTSGGCRYGKDCKYSHGPDKSASSNNQDLNFLGLPIRPGEKECPYYMRTGSCKYGSNCRFHHPEPKAVAGGGFPSGYGNDGSLPSQPVSVSSSSSWSSPMTFTDTPPFVPAMFSPTQGVVAPPTEWNGYQPVAHPTPEKGLPMPPAFAMNNLPPDVSLPKQYQHETAVEEYPERPGEPECTFFLKTGDCKFKSNCKFHHPKNRSSHTKDQPICAHYQRYGICKYGPACKYDHPPKFEISPSPDVPPSGDAKIVDGAETSEQGNEAESSV